MDQIIQHTELEKQWGNYSFAFQMTNIGSEVSRAIKNEGKPSRFKGAFERALELFDFSIESATELKSTSRLRELCRAREEFCDYFNGNSFQTNPKKMQKYYDDFTSIAHKT